MDVPLCNSSVPTDGYFKFLLFSIVRSNVARNALRKAYLGTRVSVCVG